MIQKIFTFKRDDVPVRKLAGKPPADEFQNVSILYVVLAEKA